MTRHQIVFAVLCFLAALSLVMMAPAFAQSQGTQCGDHDKIAKVLSDKYGESSTDMGLIDDKTVAEIFQSKDGETWTLMVSQLNGRSCLIASGTNWMPKKPQIQGSDS